MRGIDAGKLGPAYSNDDHGGQRIYRAYRRSHLGGTLCKRVRVSAVTKHAALVQTDFMRHCSEVERVLYQKEHDGHQHTTLVPALNVGNNTSPALHG